MSAACNSVSDWRSSSKTATFFGLKRNHSKAVHNYVIQIHKSIFLAANGGLILSTSTHGFLLKILSPPDERKIVNYWTLNGQCLDIVCTYSQWSISVISRLISQFGPWLVQMNQSDCSITDWMKSTKVQTLCTFWLKCSSNIWIENIFACIGWTQWYENWVVSNQRQKDTALFQHILHW